MNIKKSFLLSVLLLIGCNIQNIYASYTDYFKLVGCAIPGLAVCAMKMTNNNSDFVQLGGDIKTQAAIIFINFGVDFLLLRYKKNTFNTNDTSIATLTVQGNMKRDIFCMGVTAMGFLFLTQYLVLGLQDKLTAKDVPYILLTTLIHSVPGLCFIVSKNVVKKENNEV